MVNIHAGILDARRLHLMKNVERTMSELMVCINNAKEVESPSTIVVAYNYQGYLLKYGMLTITSRMQYPREMVAVDQILRCWSNSYL